MSPTEDGGLEVRVSNPLETADVIRMPTGMPPGMQDAPRCAPDRERIKSQADRAVDWFRGRLLRIIADLGDATRTAGSSGVVGPVLGPAVAALQFLQQAEGACMEYLSIAVPAELHGLTLEDAEEMALEARARLAARERGEGSEPSGEF